LINWGFSLDALTAMEPREIANWYVTVAEIMKKRADAVAR
jgi:hypothetical protein